MCVCVCVCVCVCAVTLLRPILCPDSFSVHGISQARILEWVAIFFSRGSSITRNWTHDSCVSCLAGGFFTTEPPGKPYMLSIFGQKKSWLWPRYLVVLAQFLPPIQPNFPEDLYGKAYNHPSWWPQFYLWPRLRTPFQLYPTLSRTNIMLTKVGPLALAEKLHSSLPPSLGLKIAELWWEELHC